MADTKDVTADAELLGDIRKAEKKVAFAEVELDTAKAELKMKKEAFDLAVSEMRSIITDSAAPLFDAKTGEVTG